MPHYAIPTATPNMRPTERLLTLLGGWGRVPGLVRALRPDVVHVHALPTPAAAPLLRLVPRLVVSVWGSDVVQRDRRKAQLYPWLLAHAAEVTATSQYLAGVTKTYLRAPRPVHVVPFGVDVATFHPVSTSADPLLIGTLRHLEANYGIDVLVAALPLLMQRLPQLKVVIGGVGSLAASLQAQAQDLRVANRIDWRGRIPHQDVPAFLRSLGVFVMPSRAESFGVAALEAQACGVPVVATNVGGLPEVVRDGETGLLVPPNDPRALAEGIQVLLSDPQRRSDMGRAGVTWVRERYLWQASVSEMLGVYARVW
jgi:glycosyltransferase involved in cell wall biosynthesis